MDETTQVFRPTSGRWLAGTVAALAAFGLVSLVVEGEPAEVLRYGSVLVLVAALVWAAYWLPAVEVSAAGVTLRNVLRTVELPWPSIQRIDTRYALTLVTAYGTYSAWAAPAPGNRRSHRETPAAELRGLPETTYGAGGSVRPGDLPSSPSGAAAAIVRRRWEELRDAGHLDDPRLERPTPRTTWHRGTLTVLGVLTVATVVALLAVHQP
ncbi:PH domain-containing protein [Actinotalea ferrariae]|uniref:PH domain-containing protein n=1 Tax=Actinotalea ferrariae TaxID=1386098 RepID=UPI0027E04E5F|nr:PH domain-containing protein [Actinotalea ferrariae]